MSTQPVVWETVGREFVQDFAIFSAWYVRRRHPGDGREGRFVVLETPTWVNIIPVTEQGELVLIEQYRHGRDEVVLEIPGGMVATGEEPRQAAERECREETGYAAEQPAQLLGACYPNPAFQSNVCYSYLWRGCRRVAAPQWDRHEEIAVRLLPLEQLPELLRTGQIRHALVLVAFLWAVLSGELPL